MQTIRVFINFEDFTGKLNNVTLTVDMEQWSRVSSANSTVSLMKTALALKTKEENRLMWI